MVREKGTLQTLKETLYIIYQGTPLATTQRHVVAGSLNVVFFFFFPKPNSV